MSMSHIEEIKRLRAAVKSAYIEGFMDGADAQRMGPDELMGTKIAVSYWKNSDNYRELFDVPEDWVGR